MLHKVEHLRTQLSNQLLEVQQRYKDLRVYDVGSYALNRLTPRQGYSFEHQLAYGLKARQRFDLFRSHQPLSHRPLIVFVHGGAWLHGDKKDYRFIGEAFAKEGYDVVVMNYHLAPEHIFPMYINDLHLLLNHLQQAETQLNISTENLVLMGHSAGAFNVMSALYHPQKAMIQRENIRAIIGLAGPYHFDYKNDPICADAFDQSIPYQQVMPYYFVENSSTRHYLFMAERDTIVGHFNSQDLDQVLKDHGNHCELVTIPKLGHITLIGSLSSLFSRFFETKPRVMWALEDAFR
ncbi:alpha/beta hydrolase [Acinetobacter bohemicus]|uniref:alpha/beta hydrolase n=1 Tax=Acinetobacter TaxID=469 RepID=UPI00157CAD99|nr:MULTISPECIES: alpha/beta hydrolase [Acinetobacter]MCO8041615.1 alpha/beta hydrolase [Acinetobacter sp. S4400-12]MCU7223639.1 alpha/beta hydrolase [Acinetobacter bohemicus]MDM1780259.1 alpha/beta hydrolase [Acinetobacter indicus]QKQ70402.1 alpha/beta hydrolase [Acinetobacter sp. 10FS3-1]